MNDLVNYAYESGICLAAIFGIYWLFLRKETYFQFNRFYLLGAVLISILLPLGQLSILGSKTSTLSALPQIADSFRIPELSSGEALSQINDSLLNWPRVFLIVYLSGASFLTIRMIMGIIRVNQLKRKGSIVLKKDYSIVHLEQDIAPFSFFSTIFLNIGSLKSSDERHIINHELIHINQRHSFDNLFIELSLAIFWFNPFMWFIRKALRDSHEYMADRGVVKTTTNTASYQTLLLSQISGLLPIAGTNNFNSTIKSRIKMMCRNNSSVFAKLKPLLIVPVVACLSLLFACEENALDPLDELIVDSPASPEESAASEELFYIVEDMPQFNGAEPATEFRKYIAKNLEYPQSAVDRGKSGRVIVQFAVNSKGDVVDAVVVRSVDPSLDEEAIRVVTSSPPWTPGKQKGQAVKVLFTFPINFVMQ